ncbi:Retrovirus-related Pol polyprotein from transposon TNT 1-94 [Cardamine amara subsp. amara]|uniref:Retrovirus-related Pol polyprotein from transposon TNT 1-94 n=1 Tax=Cardamine amara subsp. amara TaxID=228776 RepID=A0ABD1BR80_CARAN
MSSACKNIIAELNRGDKLEGDNYDSWYRKVQYVLEEQEVKETLFHLMEEPEQGTTAQHIRDQEAYNAWKRKNSIAHITLLSCMQDDLMCEFEEYKTAKGIWEALKDKLGATSATKVRRLNQKFNDYKKHPNQSMRQHLRVMSNMIRELKTAGKIMSDEQQVQAVLRSLPESWDHMKIQMTHNDNVKTFEDISRDLELEDERLEVARPFNEANYASSSSGMKRKRGNFGNKASEQANPKKQKKHTKRGKKGGKKNKTKMKCYNCDSLGHFARECTEAKKILSLDTSRTYAYVSSCVMLAESNPLWIVDSGATYHVARSHEAFTEYRRIPKGTRWLYVGNNTKVAVMGIGTCQLHMHGGKTLILHDVLYALEIRWDLVSVLALLKLGFSLNFYDMGLHISLGSVFYGSGYTYDGFIVLDCNTTTSSNNNDCFSFVTSSTNNETDVWHARLGHIGVDRMKRLAKEGLLLAQIDLNTCESCLLEKR